MEREKSVKVKEVIESLCKLLCALGVQSVPGAETFRRAKFNKTDAASEMWQLLYSIYVKAFQSDCDCLLQREHDPGVQAMLVRNMLVHYGYGAHWLHGDGSQLDEVGSRELLLALGWVLSSGNLLEKLLGEAALGPDVLSAMTKVSFAVPRSTDAPVPLKGENGPLLGTEEWERALRNLLWQHGKLTFLRRSLQAAQEERAGLLHQILSSTRFPGDSQHCDAKTHLGTTITGHSEELERLQLGTRVLERYLDWKVMEGLFWCWMGSVIDAKLANHPPSAPVEARATRPKAPVGSGGCRRRGGRRGDVERLVAMLQWLQTEIGAMCAERGRDAPPWESPWDVGGVKPSERAEIKERVRIRLLDLSEAYTPTWAGAAYRLRLQGQPGSPLHTPTNAGLCQTGWQDGASASQLIEELREKESVLRRELGRLRQGEREEILEQAGRLQGLVLLPPPKR